MAPAAEETPGPAGHPNALTGQLPRLIDGIDYGLAALAADGTMLYVNRRLADCLGVAPEGLLGRSIQDFFGPDGAAVLARAHQGRIEVTLDTAGTSGAPVLVHASRGQGSLQCLTVDPSPGRSGEGSRDLLGRSVDSSDVADRQLRIVSQALEYQATHDVLTGLPNRALFHDRLIQTLAAGERGRTQTAILFLDLDGFKEINDVDGHAAGDAVLQSVAAQLAAVIRPMDTVARIGGDEFAVLAGGLTSAGEVATIADRLLAAASSSVATDGGRVVLGASIGISVTPRGSWRSPTDLMREADIAMYQAKERGRNRWAVFDAALGRRLRARRDVEKMVRDAIDGHTVLVEYQPIFTVDGSAVVGMEALARIKALSKTLMPAGFIGIAEQSDLILALGTEILTAACRQASGWSRGSGSAEVRVNVNVAPRQLQRGNLARAVAAALDESGLPPHLLHLEITESTALDAAPEVLEVLRRVKELGVGLGLDDFGTGYASLTALRRMPIDFVKVDQSFVSGMLAETEDRAIVAATLSLGSALGLRTVAEGVETAAQQQALVALGCDEVQGFLLGRPLALDLAERLIAPRSRPADDCRDAAVH